MTRARAVVAVLALASAFGPVAREVTPTSTTAIRVAVKGDWGWGGRWQRATTERMCEVRKDKPFRYVLTTGDNFYNPDGTATERNYESPEACLVAADRHVWRATWGNHDVEGRATLDILGARRWYDWVASGVHFIMLDSNRVASSTQRAWLADVLRNSRARVQIVVFHHPPYTVGRHAPATAVRERWVPLFERYGVDLVLTGHNHGYEHHVVRGIHYVVTGGAGAPLYDCERTARTLVKCASRHHFLLVYVSAAGRVHVRAVRPSGVTLDLFRFSA